MIHVHALGAIAEEDVGRVFKVGVGFPWVCSGAKWEIHFPNGRSVTAENVGDIAAPPVSPLVGQLRVGCA